MILYIIDYSFPVAQKLCGNTHTLAHILSRRLVGEDGAVYMLSVWCSIAI